MIPLLLELAPWLAAMGVLIGLSGFFSSSEAALFSLQWQDRRAMADGSVGDQLAVGLLGDPENLVAIMKEGRFVKCGLKSGAAASRG